VDLIGSLAGEREIALAPLCQICGYPPFDDIAGMLEVGHKGQYCGQPAIVLCIDAFRIERGQVSFDCAVEPVEHIVESLDIGDTLSVNAIKPFECGMQHGFENIGHAQGLARRSGKSDRGNLESGLVEIKRPRRVCGNGARRQHPPQ
jgi:hypothetical protein